VFVAAQEGGFMGGAVGEVHGAKLVGMLQRAVDEHAEAVLLLLETGGVRLHEANAGLIAVSEVMRAVLDTRAAGIPVIALVGGSNGCFGGMGIVARCTDGVVMSEEGRLAISGPEVIETAGGVEEFDARDRALVWRVTGGKHRYLIGDAQAIVADDIEAFSTAALQLADAARAAGTALTLEALEAEQRMLGERLERLPKTRSRSGPAWGWSLRNPCRCWKSTHSANWPRAIAKEDQHELAGRSPGPVPARAQHRRKGALPERRRPGGRPYRDGDRHYRQHADRRRDRAGAGKGGARHRACAPGPADRAAGRYPGPALETAR
jgi:biotin-independent malonate decarboxylase beta subunit